MRYFPWDYIPGKYPPHPHLLFAKCSIIWRIFILDFILYSLALYTNITWCREKITWYCVSKKFCPSFYINLPYKNWQDFLDTQYVALDFGTGQGIFQCLYMFSSQLSEPLSNVDCTLYTWKALQKNIFHIDVNRMVGKEMTSKNLYNEGKTRWVTAKESVSISSIHK